MSTNVDNRLLKSNDTSTGMSLKSALGLEQEQEQSRPASMNKAATANYLSSLRRKQDEVGDNLSRSMNKLNQSLSQAAAKSDTSPVDEQAQKMAVYSKLAGKLIDRDSSLQEKVAQNLSSNSNVVRTKDASESLQKAMDNLPPALKEGTQAGKDLAKFMVENLVALSDRKQMGAGLERDLAVRQISIPKNQPNSRVQQASSKVLSASIEYVKNNQPEVLAKIPPETKAESQTSSTTTIKAQEHSAPAQTKDTTYISALKAQRHQSAINNDQEPKAQAPQDKISAEISKRIHSLIAQAATTAKSGNLISLSPEEAERFDRTQSPQSSDNLKRIFGQNNNSSSNTSSVNNGADGELPPPSTTNKQAPTNVRQLSLAELSARANQLQTQFREERQRIVQEGKLPDPAQMPEYTFDKASVKATLTQAHIQQQQQEQQRAQQTSSLYESLARARSAISAHSAQYANQTQQAEQSAPQQQQPTKPQTTEQKPVAQDNKAPVTQQSAQSQTTEQKPVAQDNKAPVTQQSAQSQTTEQKPVAQDNKASAAQQTAQPQTTEQKPVAQDNKAPAAQQQPAQSQTTEQKPVVQDNKAHATQQPTQSQTTEQKPVAQDNNAPAAQQQPAQSQTTEQKPVVQDNKAPAAQQPAQPQTTEQKPVAQDNKAPAAQQPAQPQTTEQKPVAQDNKAPAAQQPAQPQTTEQKPVAQDNKAPAAQQPAQPQATEQKPVVQDNKAPAAQQPSQSQTTEQKPVAQDNKAPAAQQPAQSQTTEQKPVAQDNKAPAVQQPAQPQTTEQKPVVQDNKAPAAQQPAQPQTTEQKPVVQDNKAPAAQQPAQPQTTEQKPVVQDNKAPAAQQPAQPQTTEQKPVVQDNKAPAAQQPAQPQTTEQKPSNIELNHSSLNFGKTDVNLSFNAIQSSTYGGMDIMPGMTIPVSHFGQFDNDTIQPNNKALEALKVQARLLESQLKSAEQELAQLKQNATLESKPTLNTSQPVADGDEQQLSSGSNVANKPSIVPNTEVPKGPSGVPLADGDEQQLSSGSNVANKPSIVPNTEVPKVPSGVPLADGDEQQLSSGSNVANKPSIVPNTEVPKGPSGVPVADGDEQQLSSGSNVANKPSIVPNTEVPKGPSGVPVADGDEQQLSSGSNVANKPSIVPNTEVPKGPSGVPMADGDEQQLSSGSNVANKPSIVPNTEVPKGPSGVPVADGDEQQLSSGSNVANKPSIVPNTEVPKGPSGVPVTDGDEQQLSSGSNVANKPSIVPNTEVPKGPSGVPVADGDESVVEQKVDTVVKPPVMTTEQPVNSNNNLAGAGAPTVEHSNRTNPFAKLYGVMQQGHYDEANIQQPNLNDKGNSSNTLGFNTALAKPMDGNSQSSQTQSNSNQYVPSGSGSMMSEASDEAQFSNNTIIVKGPVEAEAASEEPSIIDKPKHATNASATDVSKTKEFLAQNAQEAQEKEAVVQEKQATKEALEQNIKENKQEQIIQEEQVVQEEFVATMQARAQSTQQAIEQAQIQANLQAQQVQSNQQLANGKLYENGQINQFSRLYQQTISEQNAQQTRVLGSSQVNTVGDTNIKATGATIATTTTNINVETQEQGQQNTGATNLANRNTVGNTTVDQSNRLLGGDQSAVSANQLNQGTQVQGQAQTQNLANTPSAGAQNTSTQGSQAQAQGQAQVSTPAQVQGQPQAQAQAQVQGQAQTPVQGQAQAPVQGQAQVQTNVPNSNVQSQAVQPNVSVGAVSGTGAVSQMQAQVQVQTQAQAQAQIQAQIQANGNAIQMPNGLSTPVVNLDEDSLQDEIIKNVMQTVPSDDLDEFGIKNNNNLTSAPLSGVVADTDLTEDNNTFSQILNKGASEPNALSALGDSSKVVPTNSALGAAQITSGQNDPIPEESVVNNVATPKEGGILRRLASLFGRKNNVEEAVSSSSNESKSVDPSKAALDNLLNKSEQTASSQNSAATNIRMNSYESLVNKLQMAAADEALPPKMQEQAQNLLKSLQNPVNDLKTVSSWLNFVTGPMSPSSSQALALHQWAFMLLCIRFEQIGKNVEKFLKKTQGGTDKIAKLDTAIKDSAKVAQELDDVTVSKSHDLLKETFSQVERMQQQMQSIPQDQSVLRYIPLPPNYQGGKEGSFSAQKRKDEDGGTSWHLNFNLDLQDMGALQVKVKLRFPEIQMSFVAEKFETLQKVQQHMPELNAKLKEIGLTSTGSNARLGHINFNQDQAPSPSNNGSKFKYEGNAFNVDA